MYVVGLVFDFLVFELTPTHGIAVVIGIITVSDLFLFEFAVHFV